MSHFPAKRCTCSQRRLCAQRLFNIKIFQAHSSVNPLVLYLSVHFHTFRLLSFRLFIRPSIGASVPAFFRPSVRFFAVSVHTSVCTTFLSILHPCIRCSVRQVSIFLRARCFAFIYPFVFPSVLSFAFDRLTCPSLRSISHLPLHLYGHSFTHCLSSLPMVHCFGRFRLSDRTFAYPLNYSSSYRSFHSSEW